MKVTIAALVLLLLSGFVVVQYNRINLASGAISADVEELVLKQYPVDAFKKVLGPVPFEFPKDHGPHSDYQQEWWYYTGNLADAAGNRYGFQFTIFRRGITPEQPQRESEWGTHEIYFAHFTVTDVTGETFEAHERYSRAGAGLAGAQGEPSYHVWIDNWSIKEIEPGQVRLKAQDGAMAIDLTLEQGKPIALQGERGFSAKSDIPGNASYYYSITNQLTGGTVVTPRGAFEVSGNTWLDREWSTSDLPPGAVGWDWFSLQLDDEREVMFFRIRREDGTVYPGASGLVVYADGGTRYLKQNEVEVQVLDRWPSPKSGATYPAEWRFKLPGENMDLHITPLLNNQELDVSFVYWEGAVRLEGTHTGYGYVEMTGYADSMRGRM
jgi:predicted secreted hydrolase